MCRSDVAASEYPIYTRHTVPASGVDSLAQCRFGLGPICSIHGKQDAGVCITCHYELIAENEKYKIETRRMDDLLVRLDEQILDLQLETKRLSKEVVHWKEAAKDGSLSARHMASA